jgi:Xaa-Pro aminopeptidase
VVKGLPGSGDLRLAFDDAHMSVKDRGRLEGMLRAGIELVPAGGAIEALRAVKDEGELDAIRAAARLADDALTEVLGRGLVGRTEREVALDLEFTMRRMGAQAASFPPIVAAGEHGALPHAAPREVAIPAGTLCVVDWGAQLDGYASDCTRTYATGDIDPRDAEVYALVLRAQEAALAAVRPGPTGREVDAVARSIIDAAGHAEHFGHGLGHGVGLDVHEGPRLSKQGEAALAAGMVVTVEPGVYVPGAVGVRIEDLVIVTDDGAEVVSGLPKELQVVA